jgi:hypothetical protein
MYFWDVLGWSCKAAQAGRSPDWLKMKNPGASRAFVSVHDRVLRAWYFGFPPHRQRRHRQQLGPDFCYHHYAVSSPRGSSRTYRWHGHHPRASRLTRPLDRPASSAARRAPTTDHSWTDTKTRLVSNPNPPPLALTDAGDMPGG